MNHAPHSRRTALCLAAATAAMIAMLTITAVPSLASHCFVAGSDAAAGTSGLLRSFSRLALPAAALVLLLFALLRLVLRRRRREQGVPPALVLALVAGAAVLTLLSPLNDSGSTSSGFGE